MKNEGSNTRISELRGIGPARAKAFADIGIETAGDAIRYLPRAYQDRGDVRTLREPGVAADGLPHSFILTVAAEPVARTVRRGMNILKFRAFDESGTAEITYFNQPYLKNTIHTGDTFRFFGKLRLEKSTLKLTSPIIERWQEDVPLRGIVPVYPLGAGLTQKIISRVVTESLALSAAEPMEYLPDAVLRENGLAAERFAIENIHNPQSPGTLASAKKRLTFDELTTIAAAISEAGRVRRTGAVPIGNADLSPLLSRLPYELTGAQARSVSEIAADMGKDAPMNRILTGDVGSGKTICAAAAIFLAVREGHQAALMVPTEILANQHFRELEPLLGGLGYRTALLTGTLTTAQKRTVLSGLANAEIDLVIGTHALLTESVVFSDLALVVTDEQHRFGVLQRAALADKAKSVHTLVMSATPIPRTLSLIAYGDLSLSRIDEMPPGRQKVDTFVVDETYRPRLLTFIQKQASEGHQTYIVCPSVEETKLPAKKKAEEDAEEMTNLSLFALPEEEQPPLKAAVTYAAELADALPDLSVAFVHGKMKSAEKDGVMRRFAAGEIDVLVSTTVIEVGVNVPSATLMIVENAERFGLSQLHQLRGRVGRGDAKSYCILVSDAKGETARRRLDTMKKTSDGFKIAEEDLAIRGPGDFLASGSEVRQSGAAALNLAATCTDPALIEAATTAARTILDSDPTLALPEHATLRERVDRLRLRSANTEN
ncbi:MAG: ATP-dependent DNA helicase RecG [Clostridia bacterium]|nr:ATP-dependent DNA helicase RecG [Clostridia bacterium]